MATEVCCFIKLQSERSRSDVSWLCAAHLFINISVLLVSSPSLFHGSTLWSCSQSLLVGMEQSFSANFSRRTRCKEEGTQDESLIEMIFIGVEEYVSIFCIYSLIVPSPHYGGAY